MKKILCCLVATGFFCAWDLQAQCKRGEIMTDAGCVKAGSKRGRPIQPTEEETKQAAKKALHEAFESMEAFSSNLKSYLDNESKPIFQFLMGKINNMNLRTKNPQVIRNRWFPTWKAIKGFTQESGDSHLTNLIANYEAVAQAQEEHQKKVEEEFMAALLSSSAPLLVYNPEGPVMLKQKSLEKADVRSFRDKLGKLIKIEAKPPTMDDGSGNGLQIKISQYFKELDMISKIMKERHEIARKIIGDIQAGESKQDITVQYKYDANGKLQSAAGTGKVVGKDGFGNKTNIKIAQAYAISKQQAKMSQSKQEAITKNADGSSKKQNLTVTYHYDARGKLKGAVGEGTYEKSNGFGNIEKGTIAQKYQVTNGQVRLAKSDEKSFEQTIARARRKAFKGDPASVTPPPSMRTEPGPAEEIETARKVEPSVEEQIVHCDHGTWSPTLRRCIEEEVQEEAAPPDCPGGSHWSPTLKSCQPD